MSSAVGRRVADVADPAGAGAPGMLRRRVPLGRHPDPARRPRDQVRHRAVEQDPAGIQHDHPLAQRRHVLGLVGGDHDRRRLACPAQHVAKPAPLGRVQAGRRLVEDEQVRAAEHRLGEHDASALAARERAHPLGRHVGQSDQVDDPAYLLVTGVGVGPLLEDRHVVHEGERREPAGKARLLWDVAETAPYRHPARRSWWGPPRAPAPHPGRRPARWPGSGASWSCRRRWVPAAR